MRDYYNKEALAEIKHVCDYCAKLAFEKVAQNDDTMKLMTIDNMIKRSFILASYKEAFDLSVKLAFAIEDADIQYPLRCKFNEALEIYYAAIIETLYSLQYEGKCTVKVQIKERE